MASTCLKKHKSHLNRGDLSDSIAEVTGDLHVKNQRRSRAMQPASAITKAGMDIDSESHHCMSERSDRGIDERNVRAEQWTVESLGGSCISGPLEIGLLALEDWVGYTHLEQRRHSRAVYKSLNRLGHALWA